MFDPSTAQQLAESFALRPGMYVGGCVAPDELVEIFVKDVLPAGATEVGVEVGERGAISLRATLRERLSDWSREWEAALTDPRNTRVIHTLSLHLLRLASTDFDVQWSDHEMRVMFRPDPARFREPLAAYASLGFFADLATAHPGLRVFVRDRAAGLDATLTYPRGAIDRVLAEGARSRLNHPPLRIEGTIAEVRLDVAFAWHHGMGLQLVALVNGERSRNGGTHVLGFWEGVAAAIEKRLPPGHDRPRRVLTEREVPRNAVLVISVHLDDPKYGPATRDCLHDAARARRPALVWRSPSASGLTKRPLVAIRHGSSWVAYTTVNRGGRHMPRCSRIRQARRFPIPIFTETTSKGDEGGGGHEGGQAADQPGRLGTSRDVSGDPHAPARTARCVLSLKEDRGFSSRFTAAGRQVRA